MAPEVYEGRGSFKADVWAFGVICFEVISKGRRAFENRAWVQVGANFSISLWRVTDISDCSICDTLQRGIARIGPTNVPIVFGL
jgi:serine/threonine protein kinase